MTRGEETLQDAVVKLEGEFVDIGPVFVSAERQTYTVKLERQGNNGEFRQQPSLPPIELRWSGVTPAPVKVGNLKKGLYRVSSLEPGNKRSSGEYANAWVLVSDSSEYGRVLSEYRKAIEFAQDWELELEPDADSFLRAYLEYLSRQSR